MALLVFEENVETGNYEATFTGGKGTLQFAAEEKCRVDVQVKINEVGLGFEGVWSSTDFTPAHWVKRFEFTDGITVKVVSALNPTAAAYILD